jgi:hypothetical protein
MALLTRKTTLNLRDHVGVELAALSVVMLASAVLAAWNASRAAQSELDARTRQRLLPPKERHAHTTGGL